MSLIKRDDLNFPTLASIFDDLFSREMLNGNRMAGTSIPAVNIKESKDDFVVEVAAPGMRKEDFKVELNNNVLTISSERKQEETDNNEKYSRREFSYQAFSRSFTLPEIVEADKIKARYKDGVLNLTIPKKEEAKPRPPKVIDIS